jgi:hypothetical protein
MEGAAFTLSPPLLVVGADDAERYTLASTRRQVQRRVAPVGPRESIICRIKKYLVGRLQVTPDTIGLLSSVVNVVLYAPAFCVRIVCALRANIDPIGTSSQRRRRNYRHRHGIFRKSEWVAPGKGRIDIAGSGSHLSSSIAFAHASANFPRGRFRIEEIVTHRCS